MIPKIIHYCWLSDDEYPELIKNCIATWKAKLPDYEFVLWNTKKFDINSTVWTKQALEEKKYAFAADYIRLYAVYNYGGIYLDTDVEVLKSFDNLLDLPYFIGKQYDGFIDSAIFGAEKHSDWLLDCLKYYENRNFIRPDGSHDTIIVPKIMKSQIKLTREILSLQDADLKNLPELIKSKSKFYLFSSEYFSPKNFQNDKIFKTKNTYTVHHYEVI